MIYFAKIKQKLENRRLNRLMDMKRKTRSLDEKKKQYLVEEKVRKDYEKAKKNAYERSFLGKVQKGIQTFQKKAKKKRSSGIFAEEGRAVEKKQRSFNDDDPFKKWGL